MAHDHEALMKHWLRNIGGVCENAIIEQQAARIAELTEALRITLNILDEAYRNYGTEFDREDTAKAQTARAALGDKQ